MSISSQPVGVRHVDLHTHSTASDGLFAPAELVRQAREAHLDLIALTDHDSTNGVADAQAAGAQLGVTVLPGIEMNTYLPDNQGEAHVLGYLLDTAQPALQLTLATLRDVRERRGERMVEQLRSQAVEITWPRVRELTRGAVGRPHVAQALVEAGYAESVADAFDKYLSPGRPGYVPRYRLTPAEAVQLILSARGVPVLAHPARIPDLEQHVLPNLVAAGLQGLECYYGPYDDQTVQQLVSLAARFGLIVTGGTDYHGPNIHPTPLGGRPVPPAAVTALYQRHAALLAQPAPAFTLPRSPTEPH